MATSASDDKEEHIQHSGANSVGNNDEGWETATDSETEAQSGVEPGTEIEDDENTFSDTKNIRKRLEENSDLKLGFVVYRCCAYKDQAKWDRFLKKLTKRTKLNLEGEKGARMMARRIDWCVQDDPLLDGCDDSALIRRRFKKFCKDSGEPSQEGTSRYMACVMVTNYDLKAVLGAPSADEYDENGYGYVTLVSLDKKEGEMSVGYSYLVPRVYTLLEECGWDNFAVGDTDVACP